MSDRANLLPLFLAAVLAATLGTTGCSDETAAPAAGAESRVAASPSPAPGTPASQPEVTPPAARPPTPTPPTPQAKPPAPPTPPPPPMPATPEKKALWKDLRPKDTSWCTFLDQVVDLDLSKVDFSKDPLLVCNGERIPRAAWESEVVYRQGPFVLDSFVQESILERLREAQLKSGVSVDKLDVSDGDVEARVSEGMTQVKEQNPDKSVDLDTFAGGFGLRAGDIRHNVRIQLGLEKILLAGNPDVLPEKARQTVEAFLSSDASIKEKFEKEGPGVLNPLVRQLITQQVVNELRKEVKVEYWEDGIPQDAVMVVDGYPVKRQPLFAKYEAGLTRLDQEMALRSLLHIQLLKQGLQRAQREAVEAGKAGPPITPDELADIWTAEVAQYGNTMFGINFLLQVGGWPHLALYKRWRQLRGAYMEWKRDSISDDVLKEHYDAIQLFFGGKVRLQVIFVSAYDDAKKHFRAGDAFGEAHERALKAKAELDSGKDFGAVMLKYSDLGDQVFKGDLPLTTLNQLRHTFNEAEYEGLVRGATVTEEVFYRTPLGAVIGPLRGTRGWYLVRLVDYEFDEMLQSFNDRKALVREIWVDRVLMNWMNDLRREAKIEIPS